eukprot:GHUV01006990.1.p1 GENE.GHUV01006990.1~~GHUV01006990.1.p1  ORF type:complete len:276 (+),score=66.75 GHUV01006990.1:270-1097(+)
MLSQAPPNAGISPALHNTRTPQLRQLCVHKPFVAATWRSAQAHTTTPHVQQQETSTSALQPEDRQLQLAQGLQTAAASVLIANVQRSIRKFGLWCRRHRLQELLAGNDVSAAMAAMAVLPVLPGGGFSDLFTNRVFLAGFWGWFTAQTLKIFTKRIKKGVWDIRAIVDSGGMPSSHSALCAGITTAIAYQHGMGSSAFALAVAFSSVVMYDAAGVRRHAGKQAEVLNQVIGELLDGHPVSETKLKEVLGHTPLQVRLICQARDWGDTRHAGQPGD